MKIFNETAPFPIPETALSIGNFDGVHVGHQALFNKLKQSHYKSCLITFKNHPLEVLKGEEAPPLLCTYEHKIKLIEKQGIDYLIPLNFTKELSSQTAEQFLNEVRSFCPFKELVLGPDATIGRNKHGNSAHLQALAARDQFRLFYLDAQTVEGIKVSSSALRALIQKGDLATAQKLLGRKFSILAKLKTGLGMGRRIGFPTLNFEVGKLCLPPFGVYAVQVFYKEKKWKGVANIGIAPTIKRDRSPVLEVHLLEPSFAVENESLLEVVLEQFIRPEIRFETVEDLKIQIARDIQTAVTILT